MVFALASLVIFFVVVILSQLNFYDEKIKKIYFSLPFI